MVLREVNARQGMDNASACRGKEFSVRRIPPVISGGAGAGRSRAEIISTSR
jgi:hypothetical protein